MLKWGVLRGKYLLQAIQQMIKRVETRKGIFAEIEGQIISSPLYATVLLYHISCFCS